MNQKKNTKILLILIIILLVITLVGGIVFAYFATDLFKSNKDLFFKYIVQMADNEDGFIDENLKKYFEKQSNTPYIDEGKFSVNIIAENGREQFENANNFNISFSGQVDASNSKAAQDISLNYSESVKFPISYRQIEKTIGLQTKYIGSKFVAVETDKLSNLSNDIDDSLKDVTTNVENVEKIKNVELTDEEKNHIKDTYSEVLKQQLNENNFSKIEESNATGYKLSLAGDDLKNIIIKLMETLKNDQTTLDKLNEYIKIQKNSVKITIKDIESEIENINENSDFDNQKIEIMVYKQKGTITKISVVMNETKIELQKVADKNENEYNLTLEITKDDETSRIYLKTKYLGLETNQSINENYELGIETSEMKYKYQFERNVNFTDLGNINIEDFTNNNSMILTNYDQKEVSDFLNKVVERIQQVNKQQMEELDLEENENPIIYITPSFGVSILTNNKSIDTINLINQNNMSETDINTFNQKFEVYASTNLKGVTVKGLLSTISANNESEDGDKQIKEINFNGEEYEASEQNITFIKGDIDTEASYRVEFENDQDTGIIYRAVINVK